MTLLFLLMKILFLFILFSFLLWWLAGRWLSEKDYAFGEGRNLHLGPNRLLRALALGAVTASLLMLTSRLWIYLNAESFYESERINVVRFVLEEELGLSIAENRTWAEVIKELPVTDKTETSKDEKRLDITQQFRQAFCRDTQDSRLLDDDLKDLFLSLNETPNGPEGFVKGIYSLIGDKESSEFFLKNYLKKHFMVKPLHWEMPKPEPHKILGGIGDPLGGQGSESKQGELQKLKHELASVLAEDLGPLREKVLLAQLARIGNLMTPYYRALQLIFGPIQFLTMVLFFMGFVLLRWRNNMLYQERRGCLEGSSEGRPRVAANSLADQLVRVLEESGLQDQPEGRGALFRRWIRQTAERVVEIEYSVIDYLIWAMPSLGFIGTVLGIGAALGKADQVVRAVDAEGQAQAVTAVTALLSIAFDTTLIALICSLPLMALVFWQRSAELSFLNRLPELIYGSPAPQGSSQPSAGGGS